MKKKIIILGSISFILDKSYVGINHIAAHFADMGYEVTYLSSASSIFDLFSNKRRRKRFFAAWVNGGRFKVKDNLEEVIIKMPWILNKSFWAWQFKLPRFLNKQIFDNQYDILIATIGSLNVFSDQINANYKILRLQDSLNDFGMSKLIVKRIELLIRNGVFQQIWSVSYGLCNYMESLGMAAINYYLPNGVNLKSFLNHFQINSIKKVVYVGAFDSWVDTGLIFEVAKILKDWQFDLFGPGFHLTKNMPHNVKYKGVIDYKELPELFTKYSVGIIPFTNSELINVIERPLKFSQYLASGLGIASSNYGGLKRGMGQWASYGNTPNEFANAIILAYEQRKTWTKDEIEHYLQEYDWQIILQKMDKLIENSIN